jgi:hypothetical protein
MKGSPLNEALPVVWERAVQQGLAAASERPVSTGP